MHSGKGEDTKIIFDSTILISMYGCNLLKGHGSTFSPDVVNFIIWYSVQVKTPRLSLHSTRNSFSQENLVQLPTTALFTLAFKMCHKVICITDCFSLCRFTGGYTECNQVH